MSISVITNPSLDSIKKRVYYQARHGMAVALCELLTEVKESDEQLRDLISQVSTVL